ncbi:MAG: hypothetical protein JXR29_04915 [Methylothermaceae bacterium]|nr:hypothetical protein [Methylothermaceae bacterium]
MDIDWITVSAQIVNFLILVWLLKHFLYQPIIRAMDRREQRITDQLIEARERERQADASAKRFENKIRELEDEREETLAKAKEEAEQLKQQMLDRIRQEVAETRADWQRQVLHEKKAFLDKLRREGAQAVQAIARKALGDLANAELEKQIVHAFLERLNSLDEAARKALTETSEPAQIVSSFELDPDLRQRLSQALNASLDDDIEVRFARSGDLMCGIKLNRGGQQLGWNLDQYLDDLANRIEALIKSHEPPNKED